MQKTTIELELLTPTYMGGATTQPEIRPPSFKGLLRFWFRALDPEYKKWEAVTFGGTTEKTGMSPILLRVGSPFNTPKLCHLLERPRKSNSRTCKGGNLSGIQYLAFPMGMRGGIRDAIAPNQRFSIDLISRKDSLDSEVSRRWAMSWWALAMMGGVGGRSRRGFGSIAVTRVQSNWKAMNLLRFHSGVSKASVWWKTLRKGLSFIREQFKGMHKNDHFHIGKGTRFLLLGTDDEGNGGFDSWYHALNHFGNKLKESRNALNPEEKAALGLPIKGKGLEIKSDNHDRGASPLMANIVRIEEEYFVLVTLTQSPVCEKNEEIAIDKRNHPKTGLVDYGVLDDIFQDWSNTAIEKLEVK